MKNCSINFIFFKFSLVVKSQQTIFPVLKYLLPISSACNSLRNICIYHAPEFSLERLFKTNL